MAMNSNHAYRQGVSFPILLVISALLVVVPECDAEFRWAQATPSEQEEWLVLGRLWKADQQVALRQLSPHKKARWIELLREYDPAHPFYTQPNHRMAFNKLLALDDRETAEWMIADYQKIQHPNAPSYEMLETIAEWHTPEGIAFLAQQTLSDEPYIQQGGSGPISFGATNILLEKMLPHVVPLPMPVREWAKNWEPSRMRALKQIWSTRDGDTREASKIASDYVNYRGREIAQTWWRANEKAILAGHWDDIRPGEGFETPKFHAILAQLGGPRLAAGSTPKSLPAALPPAMDVTTRTSLHYRVLIFVTLAFVIAISGWLFLRRMKKSTVR